MMAFTISDFDTKINGIIGGLLMKADPVSKSVISAFDPSKDVSVNRSVLGGSKFNSTALDTCAEFLNIETSVDSSRIYSNKLSLANRIIL